jgi:hypothetical protein
MPVKDIAAKMGLTEVQVTQRLADLAKAQERLSQSGYDQLSFQFGLLCQQYQLVGESLKAVAMGLSNLASSEEIRACLSANPEEALQKLSQSFIILRPFQGIDPIESLEKHLKDQLAGN